MLIKKIKYRYNIRHLRLNSFYIYNFKFVIRVIRQKCINYLDFIAQSAKLYLKIYTNNKYINHTKLIYLHYILKSKVKCKYNSRFLKLRKSGLYEHNII